MRYPGPTRTFASRVNRIRDEIQALEDSALNPTNREKLQQAKSALECAARKFDGGESTLLDELFPLGALAPRGRSGYQAAEAWRMISRPQEFRLAADESEHAAEWFRPELSAMDSQAWRVGDRQAIRLTSEGVSLGAGSAGNFLLTCRKEYSACSMKITLTASETAEAFLALRAHQEPDGWHAVTSRIICLGGNARAGLTSQDFQAPERGALIAEQPADKPFMIRFEIDEKGNDRVLVGAQETSSTSSFRQPVPAPTGSAGLFVKTGTIQIKSLRVT
jgi:hypothetical protein